MQGTNRPLCTRTQEKAAVSPQETNPDLPECPGASSGVVGGWWPAAGLRALDAAVRAWDVLKEVATIVLTSAIV